MSGSNLLTISRPDTKLEDTQAGGDLFNRTMSGVVQANNDYNRYTRDAALDEAPFQTISGPTAESMNSGQSKMGTFEFLARGGVENTAKGLANKIHEKRKKKEAAAQYERLLSLNEQGGQMLYDDALKTYGPQIKDWIPNPSGFYDKETGSFMPDKYAKHVAYGITVYEKAKAKAEQMRTISGSLGAATSRQDAAAGVVGAGGQVKDYKDAIDTLPPAMTDKDKSDIARNEADILLKGADINLKGAQQQTEGAKKGYYNRMPNPSSGGRPKTPQDNINQIQGRIIQYENLIKQSRAELRDPNRNPDAESDVAIDKKIKSYERAIGALKGDIDREKAKIDSTVSSTPATPESYALADDLQNSIYENIPEGYTIDEQNMEVMDDQGVPQPGMYDEVVISRVLNMMDEKQIKLPGLGLNQGGRAAKIKRSIATVGLKETLDALQQLSAGGK